MLYLRKVFSGGGEQEYALKMQRFADLNMQDGDPIMTFEESVLSENFETYDGMLRSAKTFGFVSWDTDNGEITLEQFPEKPEAMFEFHSDAVDSDKNGYKSFYFSGSEGGLYKLTLNSAYKKIQAQKVTGENESGESFTYFTQFKKNGENCALTGNADCGPYVFKENGGFSLISSQNKPHMQKTAMHYSRMFGVGDPSNPRRIWFSKIDDPCDFTISADAGGYIDITDIIGNTIDVISFFDTLYVFCRFGIMSVDSLAAQSDFSMENVYFSNSEIIKGSIRVCGNVIIFATRYGIYSFNGVSVTCISNKIRNFFTAGKIICRNEVSSYYHDCYFLTFHRREGEKKCGVLVFNFITGQWRIMTGHDITSMAIFRDLESEKLLVGFSGTSIVMEMGAGVFSYGGAFECVWQSPKNDFDMPNAKKRIKEVHFYAYGTGEMYFHLCADGKTESHAVQLSENEQFFRLPFKLSGDLISFKITNSAGSSINVSPVTFIYTSEREYAK